MRKILVILSFAFCSYLNGQSIQWLSFEEAEDSALVHPKPVMVFIHTDWCKYCLLQEQNVFADSAIIEQLNKKYYCVKLNAEHSLRIKLLGKTYLPKTGSYHELATFLGAKNGRLAFPTTVFLSNKFVVQLKYQGMLDKTSLSDLLKAK